MALFTLVGLALRLHDIGRESFWLDEAGRAAIAALPLRDIPAAVGVVELSPPLYHLLLHFWMRLVGDGDVPIRLFSALLVIPTVPLAWSIGTALGGRWMGAVTALLSAVSPFAVRYGQEAAMYALLLVLSLAATRSAIAALVTSAAQIQIPSPHHGGERVGVRGAPSSEAALLRKQRTMGLAAYVVLGTLALYTHYYAVFLLAAVASVGIARALSQRSRHGLILWVAAHVLIGLFFLPWVGVMGRQAALAASVPDWSGVSLGRAITVWSGVALADGSPGWVSLGGVALLSAGSALGLARLPWRSPSVWLMAVLVVGPLLAAALSSVALNSFRERGLMVAISAVWALLAASIAAQRSLGRWDALARGILAIAVATATFSGLSWHGLLHKEDWRSAARNVAASAAPDDPIFFVHFASQLPFDRYYSGPQPRVGLPASFGWEDGYTARFLVTADDVERRVPPALVGKTHAWIVLSHDRGRGSDYLVAALDRWGTRVIDNDLDDVRVIRYASRTALQDPSVSEALPTRPRSEQQ